MAFFSSADENYFTQWNMSNGYPTDKRWTTQSGLVIEQKIPDSSQLEKKKDAKRPSSKSKFKDLPSKRNKESTSNGEATSSKKSKVEAGNGNKGNLTIEKPETISFTTYKITVKTGDIEAGGTKAPVYFQMKNESGQKSNKRRLVNKQHLEEKTGQMHFSQGSLIAFNLQDADLGDIHSIKLGIDQKYDDECWFCESVTVKNKQDGRQWNFPCNQWLGENKELSGNKEATFCKTSKVEDGNGNDCKFTIENFQPLSSATYKITVKTGDMADGGTKAPVYFQMKDQTGLKSFKKRLINKQHLDKKTGQMHFSQGSLIACRLHDTNLGDIHSIKLDVDQMYDDECWFCESVTVKNKQDGRQWSFPCNQWLGENKDPGETFCILLPEKEEEAKNTFYQITTVTGSDKNSEGTTNVLMTLYSDRADSGTITLNKKRTSTFQRGASDVFVVEAPQLSEVVKARVWLPEDEPSAKDWFLDRIVIKMHSQPQVAYYGACCNWISQFGIPTDLSVSTDPLRCARNNRFRLTFFTGDLQGSGGTSADVFVRLLGTYSRSDDIRLTNDGHFFKTGAVSEHDLETTFLGGTLRQLTVSHDSSGDEPEWYLEKVIVDQLDCPKRIYEFSCHRWLSAQRGDGLTTCTLLPEGFEADLDEADLGVVGDQHQKKVFEVKIRVSADSVPKRTPQSVYIVLYGEEQCGADSNNFIQVCSGRLLIKGNFEAYQTVEERVTVSSPSPLTHVVLGLKGEEGGEGGDKKTREEEVLIEDVTVYCVDTRIEQYFWLNQWLSHRREGQLSERVLYERIERRTLRKPRIKWQVSIFNKAETRLEGTVNLTFWGEEGRCDTVTLIKPESEKASIVMLDDVGPFFKVTCHYLPSEEKQEEKDDELFFRRILVSRFESAKKSFTFPMKRWLSATKGPFHTLSTDSPCYSSFYEIEALPVHRYNIVIKTSSHAGAGTSAQVSLVLVGDTSDSGCRKLFPDSNSISLFDAGTENCFVFECVNLGPLDHIILSHDGSDVDEHDWLVEEVRVTCDERGEHFRFPCGRWLSANKHDCLTRLTLYPEGHKHFALCRDYTVQVHTADIQGTDEDIVGAFIILKGVNQSTSKLLLTETASRSQSNASFKQGQKVTFTFRTADLGEMQSILIGHESETKKWFLDKVFVDCEQRCEKSEFGCHRWLARSEGDGKLEVEFLPCEIVLGIPKTDYNLHFETGEHGTEGQVFITICGSRGQTKEISLRKSSNNFSSGSTDTFIVSDIDVGQIGKIRVKYIAAGKETWDLKNVKVSRGKPAKIERSGHDFWENKGVRVKYLFDNRKAIDLKSTKIDLEYNFVCNQLFRISSERPTPIHEFVPHDKNGRPKTKEWKIPCTVIIKASQDSKLVQKDENQIFLNIVGARGDTGFRCLREKIPQPGKESTFEIDTVAIGTPERVHISSDNSLKCRMFSVDLIVNKKEVFFPADTSFDLNETGSQLNHTLVSMNKRLVENLEKPDKSKEKKNRRLRDTFGLEMLRNKVIYTVRTFTGNKKIEVGHRKNLFVILHGNYGTSEKFTLHDSRLHSEAFQKNEVDQFDLESSDLGVIDRLTLGCENSTEEADLQIEKIEVRAGQVGTQWCFVEKKGGESEGKPNGQSKLILKQFESVSSLAKSFEPLQFYEITVKTSDGISGADTNANVFIQLYGDKTKSEILNLVPRKALRERCFNAGSTDVFIRELENVGESLSKVRIGHDNSGLTPGWHLEWVKIRRLSSEYSSTLFYFHCGRWLARDEDDKALERELNPSKVYTLKYDSDGKREQIEQQVQREALKKYIVHVYTGDVSGAGTDANVFVTVFGEKGDSGERALKQSDLNVNKFEQGDHDLFTLEAADLGRLFKVHVRHDNKGAVGAAWFLDRIEVEEESSKETSCFFCERWLSKSDDDHKIERTLYARGYQGSLSGSKLQPDYSLEGFTAYIVKVHTGPKKDMGTDANAFITLFGVNSLTTGKLALEHVERSKFEPGTTEQFHLWAPHVGNSVRRMDISHDGLLSNQAWFIQSVEIDCPTLGKNYVFKMDSWLGVNKQGVGSISEGSGLSHSIAVSDGETVNYLPKTPFMLTVTTGDFFQAGTDCKVQVTLFGKRGTSEPTGIPKMENRFERGQTDKVLFHCEDLGQLLKCRVNLTKNGFRKKWYLDKITIRSLDNRNSETTNSEVEFVHKGWFDLSESNSSADLVAEVNGKKMLKETDYEISVSTSSVRGAGTDANVAMILFGEYGSSPELRLKQSKTNTNKFENSQTDVFDFNRMLDLGNIYKTRIWHDNSGMLASWHLKDILVENKLDGNKYKFTCNKWLSRDEDDKQISREFFVEGFKKSQLEREQAKFRAIISFDSFNGTSATSGFGGGDLIFQLKSNARSTDYVTVELESLKNDHKRVEADFVAANLPNLTGISLQFEPKNEEDSVVCKSICILNLHSKMTSLIAVDKKLPSENSKEPLYVDYRPDPKEVDFLSKLGVSLMMNYEIRVFTGDKPGAGTDANVFISLFGSRGESGTHKLADSREHVNKFERKYVDTFDFKFSDLGELKKVQIEHDDWGQGAAWYLERVEVTDVIRKSVYVFPCDKWLDKTKGDRLTSRELFCRQRKQQHES